MIHVTLLSFPELEIDMTRFKRRLTTGWAIPALLLGGITLPHAYASPELAPADLSRLAEDGRFDDLLVRLNEAPIVPGADAEQLTVLIGDLERFHENSAKRDIKRRADFDEAMAKIDTFLAEGRFEIVIDDPEDEGADSPDDAETEPLWGTLEDAIAASIDAHSLADRSEDLLTDPRVVKLTDQMVNQAKQAETDGHWVEALSLYRLLNLLYEDSNRYRDDMKRTGRHVRVLQLYAPEILEAQYTERAERRAQEKGLDGPEPIELEIEPWTERLDSVSMSMLRQTLMQASRYHVDNDGYLPLVAGGVENLLTLIDTDAVHDTFPTLNNAEKVTQFREYLQRLNATLQTPGKTLSFIETQTILDRIVAMNDITVALPEAVVAFEMTEGATDRLDDFTAVIWPKEVEPFLRGIEGSFSGVGIQISRKDGQLIVVSPLEDTPAQKAGIKAGDIIATVDGKKAVAWSLDRAVREIRGPKGSEVTLGIERLGEPELINITIKRDDIDVESVRGWEHRDPVAGDGWDYWIDPDARIGYVRVSGFLKQTADELDEAVAQMQADGPINGLILDLRFNPGGLLTSAVQISDRFIDQGPIVFTVDRDRRKELTESAHRARTYPKFPVVVLINQGAASASEIVSGALQDYHRATILGTRSFGKGSVQDLYYLDVQMGKPKALLKLTTQYYMLPLERIIHRKPDAAEWGIEPDLVVEMTDQQVADSLRFRQSVDVLRDAGDEGDHPRAADILANGLDPQLEAALLVLKAQQLARHIAVAQRDEQNTLVETP